MPLSLVLGIPFLPSYTTPIMGTCNEEDIDGGASDLPSSGMHTGEIYKYACHQQLNPPFCWSYFHAAMSWMVHKIIVVLENSLKITIDSIVSFMIHYNHDNGGSQ